MSVDYEEKYVPTDHEVAQWEHNRRFLEDFETWCAIYDDDIHRVNMGEGPATGTGDLMTVGFLKCVANLAKVVTVLERRIKKLEERAV